MNYLKENIEFNIESNSKRHGSSLQSSRKMPLSIFCGLGEDDVGCVIIMRKLTQMSIKEFSQLIKIKFEKLWKTSLKK